MTPVSPPVEAVPDEVRELAKHRVAVILARFGLHDAHLSSIGLTEDEIARDVLADRAIRPASPPRADAGTFCCPMQNGKPGPRLFVVRYEDAEVRDAVFGNEAEARAFWTRANQHWNCHLFGTLPLATQPAEAVRASQEERDQIAEDELDQLYRKANADYIEAQTRGDKIAEELHSAAAFWLGENGGKSEANRAAARQARRDQRGGDGV